MVAALKEPPENSEDEIDDNMDTDGDGPLFDLFDQLYNAPNSSGMFKYSVSLDVNKPYASNQITICCVFFKILT